MFSIFAPGARGICSFSSYKLPQIIFPRSVTFFLYRRPNLLAIQILVAREAKSSSGTLRFISKLLHHFITLSV